VPDDSVALEPGVKLSILMPVYNEASTVAAAVKRVINAEYPCETEVIVVDDGSTDGTPQALTGLAEPQVRLISHPTNRGKGAAIATAAQHASGDYMIVCDADLEYDPEEIALLLRPVLSGESTVVYGTRAFGAHNSFSFWFVLGNKIVTLAANVLFNCYLSDLETCYKLVPLDVFRQLRIKSSGFGLEAELTGKLLRRRTRIFEVPITYRARGREEGKKITWRDGVQALWILLKVRLGAS
jgi:glycosyltransferase involved in cell wall biosynthesis